MGKRLVTGVVALGLVAATGLWLATRWDRVEIPAFGPDCTVQAHGRVTLDHEQMANAATVTAVGVRLGMPDQAVVVALATALQESKLRNLPHLGTGNDHDSVGVFQQRPSQGWGSEAEISQPRYAAERFYLALSEVDGWEEMRVTEAAQRVQRSAYPEAYQKWAEEANVLAAALLGHERGAVTCTGEEDPPTRGDAAAAALRQSLSQDWGADPATMDSEPGVAVTPTDSRSGWRYAHWLVAHAAGHGVTRVRFADLEWTATEGGWSPADGSAEVVRAEVAS